MNRLTPHQKKVVSRVLDESRVQSFGLYGSAGVGKTYCLDYIVQQLRRQNKKVLVTAPTHKALQVLRGKVNHSSFQTVHSYLGYRMVYKRDKVFFTSHYRYTPKYYDYVIVDEGSMVNKKMVQELSNLEFDRGTIVIPVGDKQQLNPIGEKKSYLLDFPGVTLKEIVRQKKDSKIIDLSRNLDLLKSRRFVDTKDYYFTDSVDYDGLLNSGGYDDNKYISWQRNTVYGVGDQARTLKYGNDARDYEPGEVLYFENPPKDSPFHNNQEVEVETVHQHTHEYATKSNEYELKVYWLTFVGSSIPVPVVARKHKVLWRRLRDELAHECFEEKITHPRTYYDFIERWGELRTNYSLTVHRSQGSTYKETQINLKEILSHFDEEEMDKMLYTAITRASNKIRFIV